MDILLERCPWYIGGVALGLMVVAFQWLANLTPGMTGAFGETLDYATRRSRTADWKVFLFLGVLLGAVLFGILSGSPTGFEHGQFDLRFGLPLWGKALVLAGAGILIGFGARTAGGCTSGAGLCGVPRLKKESLGTTASFVVAGMIVAQIVNNFFPVGRP